MRLIDRYKLCSWVAVRLFLMVASLLPVCICASDGIVVRGRVADIATGRGVADSIRVELLGADSVVVATTVAEVLYSNYPDPTSIINPFALSLDGTPGQYILRLSHPDYESVCENVDIAAGEQSVGVIKIRHLTGYERAIMLGEVTVTASVVQFVSRGDTLSYNADAFELAQGSMLDALVRELPGVELREGGRIYVNGRFVDRLLLDGKDFFVGDKLVLLQNLPAYTVKKINVYEQATGANELLGKGTVEESDAYVMDVVLKKGYNTGWIANAEGGGGTHSRYKGRAFGAAYTPTVRLAAYGFANNVNESGTPGAEGDWDTFKGSNGDITSQGGGMDYYYGRKDNSLEVNGNVTVDHSRSLLKEYNGTQNFLPGGDTYSRSWSNRTLSDIGVATHHTLKLRPAQGGAYTATFNLDVKYNRTTDKTERREGTFTTDVSAEGLYERLLTGFNAGDDLINRYLPSGHMRSKPLEARLQFSLGRLLGKSGAGIFANGYAAYRRNDIDASDSYLLQYGTDAPVNRSRLNPQANHGYEFEIDPSLSMRLAQGLSMNVSMGVNHSYSSDTND